MDTSCNPKHKEQRCNNTDNRTTHEALTKIKIMGNDVRYLQYLYIYTPHDVQNTKRLILESQKSQKEIA